MRNTLFRVGTLIRRFITPCHPPLLYLTFAPYFLSSVQVVEQTCF